METLHKLAGVHDASGLQSSSNERPSQPQVLLPTETLPEVGQQQNASQSQTSLSHRGSRASLPLNRQPSYRSLGGSGHGGVGRERAEDPPPVPALPGTGQIGGRRSHETTTSALSAADTEDFPWGPAHPCFPHPNPHCDPGSEESRTTRVIRVKRDWLASGDLYPQYANLYPEILDPLVGDSEFRLLISDLNSKLKEAFEASSTRSIVDMVLGVVTGFLWDDLGFTKAKGGEREVERFVGEWNEGRRGVRVVQLRRTGFMSLDFVVVDPGIDGSIHAGGAGEDYEEDGAVE